VAEQKALSARPGLHLIALCGVLFFVFVFRAPFSVRYGNRLTRTNLTLFSLIILRSITTLNSKQARRDDLWSRLGDRLRRANNVVRCQFTNAAAERSGKQRVNRIGRQTLLPSSKPSLTLQRCSFCHSLIAACKNRAMLDRGCFGEVEIDKFSLSPPSGPSLAVKTEFLFSLAFVKSLSFSFDYRL
jgi:hypothetical protein